MVARAKRTNRRSTHRTSLSHQDRAKRRQRMAAAVKRGKSVATVAGIFDVTTATVRNACRALGVVAPPEARKPVSPSAIARAKGLIAKAEKLLNEAEPAGGRARKGRVK